MEDWMTTNQKKEIMKNKYFGTLIGTLVNKMIELCIVLSKKSLKIALKDYPYQIKIKKRIARVSLIEGGCWSGIIKTPWWRISLSNKKNRKVFFYQQGCQMSHHSNSYPPISFDIPGNKGYTGILKCQLAICLEIPGIIEELQAILSKVNDEKHILQEEKRNAYNLAIKSSLAEQLDDKVFIESLADIMVEE